MGCDIDTIDHSFTFCMCFHWFSLNLLFAGSLPVDLRLSAVVWPYEAVMSSLDLSAYFRFWKSQFLWIMWSTVRIFFLGVDSLYSRRNEFEGLVQLCRAKSLAAAAVVFFIGCSPRGSKTKAHGHMTEVASNSWGFNPAESKQICQHVHDISWSHMITDPWYRLECAVPETDITTHVPHSCWRNCRALRYFRLGRCFLVTGWNPPPWRCCRL